MFESIVLLDCRRVCQVKNVTRFDQSIDLPLPVIGSHCAEFFNWHNRQHRHSGICMMTPESVHTGRASEIRKQRQSVAATAISAGTKARTTITTADKTTSEFLVK